MKTIIDDTIVTMEMMSFEDHTHDNLLVQSDLQKMMGTKPSKPFKVAYINLRSNEQYMPVKDKLTCLVDVVMGYDFRPQLTFTVVEQEEHNEYDEMSVGGFTDDYINDILRELSVRILHNENNWED